MSQQTNNTMLTKVYGGARRAVAYVANTCICMAIGFIHWCDHHSGAVTAIATTALAIFTLFYLLEVRQQRELTYNQLVFANLPEVQINTPEPFNFGKPMSTQWSVSNSGGAVENVSRSHFKTLGYNKLR